MPHAEIMSANDSHEPVKYTPPHERKNGPWDEWELAEAGRAMEEGDRVRSNAKLVEAVAKHHEKKAAHHRKLAAEMKGHMKRGLVSEKALEKASKSNHA